MDNILIPDYSKFNEVLITPDGGIINDLNLVNSLTKNELGILSDVNTRSSSSGYEFQQGSEISDDIFDSFLPRDIDGVDEISDYLYYQSKDV